MGWIAAVGGGFQLLLQQVMPRTFADASGASTFLVELAPGITAITGVGILAYQQWRATRRKELLADQDAFKSTWEGRIQSLEQELKVVKLTRDAYKAEVRVYRRKSRQNLALIEKLKTQLAKAADAVLPPTPTPTETQRAEEAAAGVRPAPAA